MMDIRDSLGELLNNELDENSKNYIRKILELDPGNKGGYDWLTEVCVGLARFFDESNVNWRNDNNTLQIVERIVLATANKLKNRPLPYISKQCGQHEDKACVIAPLGPRCIINKCMQHPDDSSGNYSLQPIDASSFVNAPLPVILSGGAEIQRIVEHKEWQDPPGLWWKPDHNLPAIKRLWRKHYAVLKSWNRNGYHIDTSLQKDTPAWLGYASSQKVPWDDENEINLECILDGGALQLLIYHNGNNVKEEQPITTNW